MLFDLFIWLIIALGSGIVTSFYFWKKNNSNYSTNLNGLSLFPEKPNSYLENYSHIQPFRFENTDVYTYSNQINIEAAASLALKIIGCINAALVITDVQGKILIHNTFASELAIIEKNQIITKIAAEIKTAIVTRSPVEITIKSVTKPIGKKVVLAVKVKLIPIYYQGKQLILIVGLDGTEADRLEETRRDFVANISHELKTPVSAISLLAEALAESTQDPNLVKSFSEQLSNESQRLSNMITELISLSMLQGAKELPDLTTVAIDEVITATISRLTKDAENANISIKTDNPCGIQVKGDKTLLITALSNLVANAIIYSPPYTEIKITRQEKNNDILGNTIEIAVTDQGIGIPETEQERVFERFYRVDKARSRSTGGTGLGLAIVKHIIVNHGGNIRLESELEKGSTFTLILPKY